MTWERAEGFPVWEVEVFPGPVGTAPAGSPGRPVHARTSGHFCPHVNGPRSSQIPGAGKAGSGCQGSGTSTGPCALSQLGWLPVTASKGCVKQAGGPGGTGLPESEMAQQREAVVSRAGGSLWREGGRAAARGRQRPREGAAGRQEATGVGLPTRKAGQLAASESKPCP